MTNNSFSTTMAFDRTAQDVYRAVCNPRAWWSATITGSAEEVGDEFVFDSPGHHHWHFKVADLEADRRATWRVLDTSSTDFVEDAAEWNGTEVRFDISQQGSKTSLRFTHAGLESDLECFDDCSLGWTGYITRSLYALLTTGSGEPGEY